MYFKFSLKKGASFFILAFVSFSKFAVAEAPSHVPSQAAIADRISVIMTGMPASAEDQKSLESGTLNAVTLAEKYRNTPQFEAKLALYWSRLLGLRLPIDLFSLSTVKPYKGSNRSVYRDEFFSRPVGFFLHTADNSIRVADWKGEIINKPTDPPIYSIGRAFTRGIVRQSGNGSLTEDKNPYVAYDTGHEEAPPFCRGFNFDKPEEQVIQCVYDPTSKGCEKYTVTSDFECSDSEKVDFTPTWKSWPGGKSLKVCKGVARNCSIPLANTGLTRCEISPRLSNAEYDTRLLTEQALAKTFCDSFGIKQKKYGSQCGNGDPSFVTKINAWWAPSKETTVCKGLTEPEFCGPNFRECGISDPLSNPSHGFAYDSDKFYMDVIDGFSLEPGSMIAKIIIEGRNWNEVVTSQEGITNGAMEELLVRAHPKAAARPSVIEINQPEGTYRDAAGTDNFGTPRSPEDKSFKWSKRSSAAAGVMSTMAFQQSFNGSRAKVNAAHETFLCKKFVLPVGIKPQPDSETDLTKKAVCSECHKILEPLSHFASGWQHKENIFAYLPEVDSKGSFRGSNGEGLPGLGKIISEQPEFSGCVVARTFEFFAGRSMNGKEYANLFPGLLSTFEKNNRKVWSLVPEILNSDAFKGAAK